MRSRGLVSIRFGTKVLSQQAAVVNLLVGTQDGGSFQSLRRASALEAAKALKVSPLGFEAITAYNQSTKTLNLFASSPGDLKGVPRTVR